MCGPENPKPCSYCWETYTAHASELLFAFGCGLAAGVNHADTCPKAGKRLEQIVRELDRDKHLNDIAIVTQHVVEKKNDRPKVS